MAKGADAVEAALAAGVTDASAECRAAARGALAAYARLFPRPAQALVAKLPESARGALLKELGGEAAIEGQGGGSLAVERARAKADPAAMERIRRRREADRRKSERRGKARREQSATQGDEMGANALPPVPAQAAPPPGVAKVSRAQGAGARKGSSRTPVAPRPRKAARVPPAPASAPAKAQRAARPNKPGGARARREAVSAKARQEATRERQERVRKAREEQAAAKQAQREAKAAAKDHRAGNPKGRAARDRRKRSNGRNGVRAAAAAKAGKVAAGSSSATLQPVSRAARPTHKRSASGALPQLNVGSAGRQGKAWCQASESGLAFDRGRCV